jgi:hypothetical protein
MCRLVRGNLKLQSVHWGFRRAALNCFTHTSDNKCVEFFSYTNLFSNSPETSWMSQVQFSSDSTCPVTDPVGWRLSPTRLPPLSLPVPSTMLPPTLRILNCKFSFNNLLEWLIQFRKALYLQQMLHDLRWGYISSQPKLKAEDALNPLTYHLV